MQALFALLMPWAATATALPAAAQWPFGLLAGAGVALQAWRYARLPPCAIVIPVGEGAAQVDGRPVDALWLHDRGPLLQLSWRARGRRQARLFWPDALSPARRRELRLAVQARPIPRSRP